jgi:hypothetical protein
MDFSTLIPLFALSIVLVPITGLTVVFTAKFATKPIVEAITQLRIRQGEVTPGELQTQILELSEQVETLTGELLQVKELQTFDQKLLQGHHSESE